MKLNQKLAGLTLAMSSAFALTFPGVATAENGNQGSATFEQGSSPANNGNNDAHMDNNRIPADNGGGGGGGGSGGGGNETPPVPEPETYAMMLAGLGALGMVVRRRRNRK
jgi:hypothetical protein